MGHHSPDSRLLCPEVIDYCFNTLKLEGPRNFPTIGKTNVYFHLGVSERSDRKGGPFHLRNRL